MSYYTLENDEPTEHDCRRCNGRGRLIYDWDFDSDYVQCDDCDGVGFERGSHSYDEATGKASP